MSTIAVPRRRAQARAKSRTVDWRARYFTWFCMSVLLVFAAIWVIPLLWAEGEFDVRVRVGFEARIEVFDIGAVAAVEERRLRKGRVGVLTGHFRSRLDLSAPHALSKKRTKPAQARSARILWANPSPTRVAAAVMMSRLPE